jgi:hypothetical protein
VRPEFTESKVLAAADLEDEREYLDQAHANHLAGTHGTAGSALVAASILHPNGQAAIGLGSGPGNDALTVSAAGAGGGLTERIRITGPALPPGSSHLLFARPAPAAATGPAPGTLSLVPGGGNLPAPELRIEAPASAGTGRVLEFRFAGPPIKRPLSILADGTVTVMDLQVNGELALGPAPAPPATATPDPTGSVAAAEALRQQLAQGLGIGADTGIGIAIANAAVGGGRVQFTVEVTDVQGVAPVLITIRGRVNVGAAAAADELGPLTATLKPFKALTHHVDIALPAAAKGDVIVAVTAYGVHPQAGLVSATEARLIGTVV